MEGRENDYRNANEEIYLDEAVKETLRRQLAAGRRNHGRVAVLACSAALVLLIVVLPIFRPGMWGGMGTDMNQLFAAEYPPASDFEEDSQRWWDNRETYGMYSDELLLAVKMFASDTAGKVLGQETKENLCYSPVSLYTALAMVAETAEGETREEILQALHYVYPNGVNAGDLGYSLKPDPIHIDSLADDMFRYLLLNHRDNSVNVTKIANSLWLNEAMVSKEDLRQDAMETLAEKYMASAFASDFSSGEAGKAMSNWVVKQTKGLLGGEAEDFAVENDTVMTLISTVYYYDQWYDEFDKSRNVTEPFYKADGTTVDAEYMRMTRNPYGVLAEDGYTAASLSMKGNSSITFVLPDEGMTPADILTNEEIMARVLKITKEPAEQYAEVRFKIPKYQFKSELDLTDTVKALGITSAFEEENADFSGILAGSVSDGETFASGRLWLSGIRQQTSMSIDEKGCEASAFTQIDYAGQAVPLDGIVEFTLNRPFIIIVECGGPLFIGVINQPG